MRVVTPPQSNNVQYVDNPELVQRLVSLETENARLRLSTPKPVIKEVIIEKPVADIAIKKEVERLRLQVNTYEAALRKKTETKKVELAKHTKETSIVYKIPKWTIIVTILSNASLLALGYFLGNHFK